MREHLQQFGKVHTFTLKQGKDNTYEILYIDTLTSPSLVDNYMSTLLTINIQKGVLGELLQKETVLQTLAASLEHKQV